MTPVLRLVAAVVLLAVYQHYLLPPTAPSVEAAPLTDRAILRDIDASEVAYSAGRFEDALEPTLQLTEKMPSEAMYFNRLANIYHELGRPSEEARSWEKLFEVSPTPVDACPMLGQAYEAANDRTRAIDAFERCLEIDPENPDAMLYLGRAYQGAGRGDDARRVLENGLALAPNYSDLYLLLGVRNYLDGRIDVARQQFERFLELSPERRYEVQTWIDRTEPKP
jgi:tetratricopeptide (TPR) repeat protein